MKTNDYVMFVVGKFSAGDNYFYMGDSKCMFANYENAKKELYRMRKVNPAGDIKIFQINAGAMKEIAVDPDIVMLEKALELIDERKFNKPFNWWYGDDKSFQKTIYPSTTASQEKRTITINFKGIRCEKLFGYQPEEIQHITETMQSDIDNMVLHCYMKEIQKLLKQNNLTIKVEFKRDGRKIHKGFITKGE